jgi:hypothetical protein
MKCKECGKEFFYSPVWCVPVRSDLEKEIDEYHFHYCVDCLREKDEYIDLCAKYFYETGIDVCRF